jgi:hypothetical protein
MGFGDTVLTFIENRRTQKEINTIYQQAVTANFEIRAVSAMPNVNKQMLGLVSNNPVENDVYDMDNSCTAVDYIWGTHDEPEGTIVSGGQNDARVKALMPFVRKSQMKDIPLIALHNGNKELEKMMEDNSVDCEFIGRGATYYDVFRGMSVDDMAELLYACMPEDSAKPGAEALLHALLEVVLRTHGTVTFYDLASFPLPNLQLALDNLQKDGEVTADEYREIERFLLAGSAELDNVRIFLTKLNRQVENLFGKARSNTCNIKKMLGRHGVVALDVGGVNNDLVLNLAINHLMLLQSQGRDFSILLDDIPLSRFPRISDFLRGRVYAISHNDFVSSLSGGAQRAEDLFSEITGNVATLVLFKHSSGTSCQKWSAHLGNYHRIRVDFNITQNRNYKDMMSSGDSRTVDVDERDEPRVRAETIGKLSGSLACIHNSEGTLFAQV